MRFLASRIRTTIPSLRKPTLRRTVYSREAEFITSGPGGSLVKRKVAVGLGDPHEAFTMVPTEIGQAFQAGIFSNSGPSLTADPELCPLTFYHDTRHFAYESSSYPQLIIPQDLPRRAKANMSPATLHLFGATHTITLDGTYDAQFAKHLRDSLRDLKDVLDELKDR